MVADLALLLDNDKPNARIDDAYRIRTRLHALAMATVAQGLGPGVATFTAEAEPHVRQFLAEHATAKRIPTDQVGLWLFGQFGRVGSTEFIGIPAVKH